MRAHTSHAGGAGGNEPQSHDVTHRLTIEAESFLGPGEQLHEIERELARLVGFVEELSESERRQFDELASLMAGEPGADRTLAALRRDGTFAITVAPDAMSAVLAVRPATAGGQPVTALHVFEALEAEGVCFGVNREAVEELVAAARDERCEKTGPIAGGRPPSRGVDGDVTLYARGTPDGQLQVLETPDRVAAHHRLCKAGDVVLAITPPRPGLVGSDVYGRAIEPEPPNCPEIEAGEQVCARGLEYCAEADGVVVYEDGRISVVRILVLTEDLTRRTGPIEFNGQVLIRGHIRTGASVAATGDVRVEGTVEGATIESGGDVELCHGIAGQNCGLVRAAGSITARFAENATLYAASGTIDLKLGAINSHLTAGQAIVLVRGQGRLTGGAAVAGKRFEAKQIGSAGQTRTEVRVGITPAAMQQLAELDHQTALTQGKLDRASELSDRLLRMVGKPEQLAPRARQAYVALRKIVLVTRHRIDELERQRQAILDTAAQGHGGSITAFGEVLPGAVLRIGRHSHVVEQSRRAVRFRFAESAGRIVAEPAR